MAEDKRRKGSAEAGSPEGDDFGALTGGGGELGNLPPLSDFESSEGSPELDSNLPPLSSLDSDAGGERESAGGLPPIGEIPLATPVPTGGAIKPPPPGFENQDAFDTPLSSKALETPETPEPTGFQDLSADSDFTPETPDVAPPGPDSDLETPMFDSAFGAGGMDFGGVDTSAPTQAMVTPMFGEAAEAPRLEPGGMPFDSDAFAGLVGGGGEPAGTPRPDFAPDTAAPAAMAAIATPAALANGVEREKAGFSIVGLAIKIGIGVAALLIGLLLGPTVVDKFASLPIPNPTRAKLDDATVTIQQKDSQIKEKDQTIAELMKRTPEQGAPSAAEIKKLTEEQDQLKVAVTKLTTDRNNLQGELKQVESDIEAKNDDYVQAQQEYEDLLNQKSIVTARRDGLGAEVDRLQGLVGQLEDANARRVATKDALQSSVERLVAQVKEGCPLTPEKYSYASRVAAVDALKAKVAQAPWVAPELLDEYTKLYNDELAIAATRTYFFARIPVADRFGTKTEEWAECLQNGNWSVYYRTLDGKHIGVYQNVAESGPAQFEFREELNPPVQKEVEQEIVASRTPDYQKKIEVLAQKQLGTDDKTSWQKSFESLM